LTLLLCWSGVYWDEVDTHSNSIHTRPAQ